MARYVIGFRDDTEIAVERSGAGELLVHAKLADKHIDQLGLRVFARPVVPGSIEVTLAGMEVEMVRWLARAHGGIDQAWSEKQAFQLLKEFAAAETPMPDTAPEDPPEIAEVLRLPREAASPAAPFRGPDAAVSAGDPGLDAPALRPLEADPVMAAFEDARARFTEALVRPIEPPSDPIYARHWNRARGWRSKVSSLRVIAEILHPALEPEHAGHPLQARIAALRERIAETAAEWRKEALLAEDDRRAA